MIVVLSVASKCGGSGGGDDSLALLALLGAASGASGQCATRSWNHPAGLSDHITESGAPAENPALSMNSSGYGVMAYLRNNDEIRIREYQSGAWSGPVVVKSSVSEYSLDVAVNESGDAILGYIETWEDIGFVTRTSGSWSAPATFTPPFGTSCHPWGQVAIDGSGNGVFAYDGGIGGSELFRSEYRGGTWTHPAGAEDALNSGDTYVFSVAGNSTGMFAIIWTELVSNDQTFVAIRNGTWDDPDSTADNLSPDGQDAEDNAIAMDDSGNIIAVWSQSDGSHRRIYKAEYANGTWSVPSGLSDAISPSGTSADYPVVAMNSNGAAIIAWQQSDGSHTRILASVRINGTWTHPASVSNSISAAGSNAYSPEVALNTAGEGLVIWTQTIGGDSRLHMLSNFSGSFQSGDSLAQAISPVGSNVGSYDLAIDNSCNATIVWSQSNGTDDQIFMSEFR